MLFVKKVWQKHPEEGQKNGKKVAQNHPDLCTVMGTQYRFRPMWWTFKILLQDQKGLIRKSRGN